MFLMVGTIEPRKDHATVIDAFQMLWESGSRARLTFVGRPGWRAEAVLARIKALAETNPFFKFHANASDELLAQCYDEASVVIASSLAEGFGLPLIESMMFGKPLIASDIPSFREV